MRRTFKYRLYPTKAQRTALDRQLEACRWVYNKTLEIRRDAWQDEQRSLGRYDTSLLLTQWKREHEWLKEGHAQALQNAQARVDLAFRAFFRRVKAGQKPGYPRFRGKGRYDSFTYPQQKGNWRFVDGRLRLAKVGNVKIKLHRPIEGTQKTLTIRRDTPPRVAATAPRMARTDNRAILCAASAHAHWLNMDMPRYAPRARFTRTPRLAHP